MSDYSPATLETPKEYGADPEGVVSRWCAEIKAYEQWSKDWNEKGKKVYERYLDKREAANTNEKRFNLLWSNVQTLSPALYSRTPAPQVTRRYKDKDPVARLAAEILERNLVFSLDKKDFDAVVRSAVRDYLLPGRGTVWYRFIYGNGGPDRIEREYVDWRDFGHCPAPSWSKVTAAWRCVRMTREQLKARFPEVGNKVPLNEVRKGFDDSTAQEYGDTLKRAKVYEIWCKSEGRVYWICPDYKDAPLDTSDDPLGLEDFFPCPPPLYTTLQQGDLLPVPDYIFYQDQASELDQLTQRIDLLTEALRVAGVYDANMDGEQGSAVAKLMTSKTENDLIPVNGFAAGGDYDLRKAIQFLPVETVASVLASLVEMREKIKQDIYEVTGIADIVRGTSDPNETLGAQRIKGQYANMRLSDRQAAVADLARAMLRIEAELMAELFDSQVLLSRAGMEIPQPDPGMTEQQTLAIVQQAALYQQALALLRSQERRDFLIDVETDSTIQPDEQAEKNARTEFLKVTTPFLEKAAQFVAVAPSSAPLMSELLLFAVRGFKAGRQVESAFETFLEQVQQQARQAQQAPPKPDPQEQELKLKAQEQQFDQTLRAQEQRFDQALKVDEHQFEKDLALGKAAVTANGSAR